MPHTSAPPAPMPPPCHLPYRPTTAAPTPFPSPPPPCPCPPPPPPPHPLPPPRCPWAGMAARGRHLPHYADDAHYAAPARRTSYSTRHHHAHTHALPHLRTHTRTHTHDFRHAGTHHFTAHTHAHLLRTYAPPLRAYTLLHHTRGTHCTFAPSMVIVSSSSEHGVDARTVHAPLLEAYARTR